MTGHARTLRHEDHKDHTDHKCVVIFVIFVISSLWTAAVGRLADRRLADRYFTRAITSPAR